MYHRYFETITEPTPSQIDEIRELFLNEIKTHSIPHPENLKVEVTGPNKDGHYETWGRIER